MGREFLREEEVHINDDEVTISRKTYNDLLELVLKLRALEGAGVDNWDGYDYAMEELEKVTCGK